MAGGTAGVKAHMSDLVDQVQARTFAPKPFYEIWRWAPIPADIDTSGLWCLPTMEIKGVTTPRRLVHTTGLIELIQQGDDLIYAMGGIYHALIGSTCWYGRLESKKPFSKFWRRLRFSPDAYFQVWVRERGNAVLTPRKWNVEEIRVRAVRHHQLQA